MKLESSRLNLTEINWNDLENIHNLYSIHEVDEFNTLGIPKDIEVTREIIRPAIEEQKNKTRTSFCWKIVLKDTNQFVGVAGMNLSNDKFRLGEIYYKLMPS
ncbi:MAG: GNAT family N-acetyltransferase, partial [bacterium]|nr:GNAT family N-acetyltransferase [bacterium]